MAICLINTKLSHHTILGVKTSWQISKVSPNAANLLAYMHLSWSHDLICHSCVTLSIFELLFLNAFEVLPAFEPDIWPFPMSERYPKAQR